MLPADPQPWHPSRGLSSGCAPDGKAVTAGPGCRTAPGPTDTPPRPRADVLDPHGDLGLPAVEAKEKTHPGKKALGQVTQYTSRQGGLVSGIGAGGDGNMGHVTAEADVTGRCWGSACCPHTAWGHDDLILIINEVSLISAQTHCSSPFPAVWSSLTQPGSSQPPPRPCSSRGSQPCPGSPPRGQGTGSRQVPPACVPGRTALGSSQAQVSPGFSRANSSQEQTRQQILGETVAAVSRRDRGLPGWPRGAVAGWQGMVPRPRCPRPEAAGPLLPQRQEPRLGRAGCGSAPSPQESPRFRRGFSTRPIQEQVV